MNLIDTADAYGTEVSELLIADALHPYPTDLVIATKGGLIRDGPNQWRAHGTPSHLRAACEASLRRPRLERIDLYQLHAVDPQVPIEESVGALRELQEAGLVRHIGVCNVSADELARARHIADIASVQNRYNLTDRSSETSWTPASARGSPSCRGPRSGAASSWHREADSTRSPRHTTRPPLRSHSVRGRRTGDANALRAT